MVDFGPKTVNFGFILAEISPCGCPARPKKKFGVKIIFCSQKKFHGTELIFGLHSPEKVQKRSILGPKMANSGVIVVEIAACGCLARPKIFHPQKNSMSPPQIFRKIFSLFFSKKISVLGGCFFFVKNFKKGVKNQNFFVGRLWAIFGLKMTKIEIVVNILAEISACGCPARLKKVFPTKNAAKFLQNKIWVSNSILKVLSK